MNKKKLEQNIKEIIKLYNSLQSGLSDTFKGVKNNCREREILNEFISYLGVENTEETRLVAYFRIVELNENPLELYLEKIKLSFEEKREKIDKSYKFVADYHSEIQAVIISVIESKQLLTPFYLEILKGVANVGLRFNDFFIPWRNHIVYGINKDLEDEFQNNSNKIIDYLNKNNLFDKDKNGEKADRCYSALVCENGKYISKSYCEVFSDEVKNIVGELDVFIKNLSVLEDEIYNSKEKYLAYLNAIKNAFLETNTDNLITKWAEVDKAWMSIKTPFQIGHPLEYYEDKYRKAVAPEWDLRIENTVFKSNVKDSILNMYETIFNELDKNKYKSNYKFSLKNQQKVQLYLSSPVFYYGSELTGLFYAQVVPNDEIISGKYGKKIFAYPEMVLAKKRNEPFMKLSSKVMEKTLLKDYRKSLFSKDEIFYKIYDIETIGHEFGHTLWLDIDTENKMNIKTGVYKNIEEFKATIGGLVMYFMNEKLAPNLQKDLMIYHIIRCIGLLKYREVNEIEPYYCESLIHLDILFESGLIKINSENKIEFLFSETNYKNLKYIYLKHYKKLINIYLNKIDAENFLSDYTIKNNGYYLPKNESIRNFVEYYYDTYKKLGNELDENINKNNYK